MQEIDNKNDSCPDELDNTSETVGTNEAGDESEPIEMEDILKKHRAEKKQLQATIQQIKKGIQNCKKRKKEATAQIAKLEAEMKERHEKELNDFQEKKSTESSISEKVDAISLYNHEEHEDENRKVSRAAKRRAKKAEAAASRDKEIAEEKKAAMHNSPRIIEMKKMQDKFLKRKLRLHDIPPDGNCMYSALAHQLKFEKSMEELRNICGQYMLAHESDFLPFLLNNNTGEQFTPEEYASYCNSVANSTDWGGHTELKALSEALKRKIQVIQADGPDIILGDQFSGDGLKLAYYRHAYLLGEHYNSVVDVPPEEINK